MTDLGILREIVVIFFVSVTVVALLRRLGLPNIAGFILVGTLIGPRAFGIVQNTHNVETLAEIGVALLLFGIGLELQFDRLRRLWRPVVIGGALQVVTTAGLTAAIGFSMGLLANQAIFLGLVIAVSSTAIVLRGLEARGETDAPHGRLTLGILIFQDLSVVPMMLSIPLLAGVGAGDGVTLVTTLLKAIALLTIIVVAARVVVPYALEWVARTRQRDLFVLTVFLVCIGTAWLVSMAGVSLALGAFFAGMVVAGSKYRHQAMAEMIPFREVFTSLFFVSVGMLLDPHVLLRNPAQVLALVALILVGKFVIVFLAAGLMRLPLRVRVLAAASLAQVGEFSFVLIRAAAGTSLVPDPFLETLMAAVIISMLVTPLAIAAGPRIAAGASRIGPLTRLLDVETATEAGEKAHTWNNHVIIAGFGITGQDIAQTLRECAVEYVVVDLNPDNVRRAERDGEPIYYGDVTSPEVLRSLGAERAREIVLVVNDPSAAERAIVAIRQVSSDIHILVRARYVADVAPLMKAGANEVVPAEIVAAIEVTSRVLSRCNVSAEEARKQIADLEAQHARDLV